MKTDFYEAEILKSLDGHFPKSIAHIEEPLKVDTMLNEEASSDSDAEKMFTAENIPEIVKLFKEADTDESGGLDMDEFYEMMAQINTDITKEEVRVLHMKIDTNCDRTVDLGELLHYLLQRNEQAETLDYKNVLFPYDFTYTQTDCLKPIVKMICRPSNLRTAQDFRDYCLVEPIRSYRSYNYITVTTNGTLKYWANDLKISKCIPLQERETTTPAYHHTPKMHVFDVLYISDLKMLAVSTSDREILFYNCENFSDLTRIKFCILEEEFTAMDYYCNGNKGIFACGDSRGFLFVYVSYYIHDNGLFNKKKLQRTSLRHYPTVTVSSLLGTACENFDSLKIFVFDDICTQVQYIPSLQSFTVCGATSKFMAVIECMFDQERSEPAVNAQIYRSPGNYRFYKSVAYSPWSRYFLTGGMSGVLRVWFPHKTKSYERELVGHKETVSHVVYNSIEKMFVSISVDKQICFWTDGDWNLKQRIIPSGLIPTAPITSVCYNIHNNELYVANSVIGKCFGRGTNVFHETLKSHYMPLCSMLYHGMYKQVVSVCQKGIVTVWDILTGKAVMEFDITPSKQKIAGNTFMSFDEVNRKLITISCDRLIKHWNFNNGEQLEILEATLPNDVTSIVLINEDMYISTKDSPKILQLDSNGKLLNEFEHFLLSNISSMDHHDDKLIAASSNGNVLTWDLETLTVLYYINTTNNPKIQSVELYLRQQTLRHDLLIESTLIQGKEKRVLLVKSLKSREVSAAKGTLLIIGDLYITVWSTTINGGLISRFKAVIQDGAKITCVSLSESETILLTGDSCGVVCLYDIEEFGLQTKENVEYETIGGWQYPLQPPPLIATWKAGTSELISVACDPACEKIITAEVDYNVKLWSSTGTFVGIFGKDRWVNMVPKQVPAVEDTGMDGPESVPQQEKVTDGMEFDYMIYKQPFLLTLIHYLQETKYMQRLTRPLPENSSPIDISVEGAIAQFAKVRKELLFMKKLKQTYYQEVRSNRIRYLSGLFNVPIEPETSAKSPSEDEEKRAEQPPDEVQVQSECLETEQPTYISEIIASTEADDVETFEDDYPLTGFDKSHEYIKLSESEESPKLSDEKEEVKLSWPMKLLEQSPPESPPDETESMSFLEKQPMKKTNLDKLLEKLLALPPQIQTRPRLSRSESRSYSIFEKESKSDDTETPGVILSLSERLKMFKSIQEQFDLLEPEESIIKEIKKPEPPSTPSPKIKMVKFTEPLEQPKLAESLRLKPGPVKSVLRNAGTVKQMLEKKTDAVPLTKSPEELQPSTLPFHESQFMQLDREKLDKHPTSDVKTFLFAPSPEMWTKMDTVSRAEKKQQQQSISERIKALQCILPTFQPVTTQAGSQIRSKTKTSRIPSLSPTSKKVPLMPTHHKPHPPKSPADLAMRLGISRLYMGTGRHMDERETKVLPSSLKKVEPLKPQTTQRGKRESTYEVETKVEPKEVHFTESEQKPQPAPLSKRKKSRCSRGHIHEDEICIEVSPLKMLQISDSDDELHPAQTPAVQEQKKKRRSTKGSIQETKSDQAELSSASKPSEKAERPQIKQKPSTPPTRSATASEVTTIRRCRFGHLYAIEKSLQVLPPITKKVPRSTTQQQPRSSLTSEGKARLMDHSHKCVSEAMHARRTNLLLLPPISGKVASPEDKMEVSDGEEVQQRRDGSEDVQTKRDSEPHALATAEELHRLSKHVHFASE